jgi:inorganic pyrophosphatase/exopolyphosphatase
MGTPVYVVGHRNPDTDSVCSAIAYAALKTRLGEPDVRPARAGAVNAETAFVTTRSPSWARDRSFSKNSCNQITGL